MDPRTFRRIRRDPKYQGGALLATLLFLLYIFFPFRRGSAVSADGTAATGGLLTGEFNPRRVLKLINPPPGLESESAFSKAELLTHGLHTPFASAQLNNKWFNFGGDTVIRNDKYIRLTGDMPGQTGWIHSRLPLTHQVFVIEATIDIHGKAEGLYGDGMAFWLTKDRPEGGEAFGGSDVFEGVGIFIDTYKNGATGQVFPFIMAMIGDGVTPYDKDRDGKANKLPNGSCSVRNIHNLKTGPAKLRITYVKDGFLAVETNLNDGNPHSWQNCLLLEDVELPLIRYLGVTALTGQLHENHDLLDLVTYGVFGPDGKSVASADEFYVSSKNSGKTVGNRRYRTSGSRKKNREDDGEKEKERERERKGSKRLRKSEQRAKERAREESRARRGKISKAVHAFGSWLWFFIKLGLLVAVAYGAFTFYRVKRREADDKKYGLGL